MKSLNERMNDNVILINVSEYSFAIATQDKPKGIIVSAGKTISVLVKDLLSSLRGNKFVYGIDNKGTNACLYVEDAEIRDLLGFDEYEIKIKGKGKENEVEKRELKTAQVVLSKDVFIKGVKAQANTDFIRYANTLKDITNGSKMMIARIILDERKKDLKGIAVNRFDTLEDIISH